MPRQRAGFQVPEWLIPLTLTGVAVVATVLGWAAFAARPTSNEVDAVLPLAPRGAADSIVYALWEDGQDNIYVRPLGVLGQPRLLASFRPFQPSPALQVRGSASPAADRVAVLWMEQPVAAAQLMVVKVAGGTPERVAGDFHQLSELAWSRDGTTVAAVLADGVTVVTVNTETLAVETVATFAEARRAAPVGYSANGRRLFVVVLDQGGSELWAVAGGRATRVSALSAGMTTGWRLSPDGARLAFVDVVGVGAQRYAGRTLMVATGEILSAAPEGDQLGAAWRPGSEVAEFGGPGGSYSLSGGDGEDVVVPEGWAPDGKWLVAAISRTEGTSGAAWPSLELVMPGRPIRVPLSDAGRATFLGFVNDGD